METRQIIKLTEQIVAAQYPETKIIAVKAGLSHQLREELEFPKNRDVNHYHHAFDAFLAARIGTYLLKRFPNLQAFFTYGKFKKADVKKLRGFNFIRDITHAESKIVAKDTGEVVWDKQRDADELDRIYNFKRMLITHEVRFETADLFKQTVYGAKDSKEAGGSKQLIPKKKGYPVDIYGGYFRENTAYLAVVKVTKKTETIFKVVKIATSQVATLDKARAQSPAEELSVLTELLKPQFCKTGRNGKSIETSFKVVLPRVPREQLFQNKKYGFFMVNSDTLLHNFQELWLSREDQKVIKRMATAKYGVTDYDLLSVFDAITSQIRQYFNLYDINQFRSKLINGREIFFNLPIRGDEKSLGKVETLENILIGASASATTSDLKNIGIKTPFGFLQVARGIELGQDTAIAYQSPSGLFKRIVRLSSL